ncbi:hypothetical protein GLOIN_2v1881079 [Rhizophagus clarus]|uniref:Uncharacterized protein n=1 Tax=Rhizophagus clarus TaxID=94130 RepID=A0A8H3R4M2_9GLOM|nr:hypothetical protein GLOIN_2v1881079 [Rhizophagus clarus]
MSLAQATVQLKSSLGHAGKWYSMEFTQDSEAKLSFKLSKPLFVAYEDVGMKDMEERVLGHIIWLLEESQKADSALDLEQERK